MNARRGGRSQVVGTYAVQLDSGEAFKVRPASVRAEGAGGGGGGGGPGAGKAKGKGKKAGRTRVILNT